MKRYLFVFIVFLISCDDCTSQVSVEKHPVYYSHVLGVRVISIDTVMLLKKDYVANSTIPSSNFKAVFIKLQILKNYKQGTKKAPRFLLMELQNSENGCLYNFEKNRKYKLFAYISKFSSKDIIRKYRNKMLRIDCYNLPQLQ